MSAAPVALSVVVDPAAGLKDFYYQIKGRAAPEENSFSRWSWPPVFSGMVTAPGRKEAKALIEEAYDRHFPTRVLAKDLEQNEYLLHIDEMPLEDSNRRRRFELVTCKECPTQFRQIDKFNDVHLKDKGADHCSDACAEAGRRRDTLEYRLSPSSVIPPVIYVIRQKSTGKCYVGQTTRPFTLRWWEHLSISAKGPSAKFHTALQGSLTDWEFSVVEVVVPLEGVDAVAYLNEREAHWIEKMDSVANGYNTVQPSCLASSKQASLDLEVEGTAP